MKLHPSWCVVEGWFYIGNEGWNRTHMDQDLRDLSPDESRSATKVRMSPEVRPRSGWVPKYDRSPNESRSATEVRMSAEVRLKSPRAYRGSRRPAFSIWSVDDTRKRRHGASWAKALGMWSADGVTIMPRITSDAVYSGSDLLSIVVRVIC
jgi:hypothetical protein